MSFSAWAYFVFTVLLGAVFTGIIVYYYSRKRREVVEAPKYRMLADDPDPTGTQGEEPRR
jgi:cbb3-type cytochrome oxidase subunit 3